MPGFLAKLDRFTIGLIVSVGAGILVPCSGVWDTVFSRLSDAAIVLLFFLYGAKLSRRSVWEGVMHWRLQGLVAASTFVIFPLLGMVSMPLWNSVLGPDLCMGMLYVCMLPSTVQSSIAFTSMAGMWPLPFALLPFPACWGCSSPPCWWGWCGPAEGKGAWIFPLS